MLLGTESVIILKTERTGLSLEKKLMVSLCEKNARSFVTEEAFAIMKQRAIAGQDLLWSGKGPGAEYLGWLDLPESFAESDLEKIETTAEEIRNTSDVFVVIGIGGSYLGSYAAISFLRHRFYNNVPRSLRQGPEIYFAGNHFSGRYLKELIEVIGERDVSVNVISKSGSTMETAVAFRFFRQYLEDRYGREEAVRRIFVTTDATQSPLISPRNRDTVYWAFLPMLADDFLFLQRWGFCPLPSVAETFARCWMAPLQCAHICFVRKTVMTP